MFWSWAYGLVCDVVSATRFIEAEVAGHQEGHTWFLNALVLKAERLFFAVRLTVPDFGLTILPIAIEPTFKPSSHYLDYLIANWWLRR